jgi:fructose-1,6-bisphosphatase/inositol monophosphatase family enzyme
MDTREVTDWVIEAGKIATNYFKKGANWRIKADDTFVSDADKAVEDFLVGKIQKRYSGHRIIAEEGSRFDGEEYTWAIDPIDGTYAFVWGVPTWCISVGLLKNKKPYWGMVYFPLLQEIYSVKDGVAIRNSFPIQATEVVTTNSLLCVSPRVLHQHNLTFPGNVCSFASGVMHNCLVARGVAIAAVTLRPNLWDLAGVLPILNAAGADVRYVSGRELDLSELLDSAASEPLVAGHPRQIDYVIRDVIRKKE